MYSWNCVVCFMIYFLISVENVVPRSHSESDIKKLGRARITRDVFVGGQQPQDPKSPEFHNQAVAALAQLPKNSENSCELVVKEVKQASTQVVAGTNSFLTVEICEKSCVQNGESPSDELTNCKTCDMQIWTQPWRNFTKLTKSDCAWVISTTWIVIPWLNISKIIFISTSAKVSRTVF